MKGSGGAGLSKGQEKLLLELPDLPSDGRRCSGGRKRSAEALVGRGWAKAIDPVAPRYARSPEGTKLVQEWERRWARVEQIMRVAVHRPVEDQDGLLMWAFGFDPKRYSELHERVRKEERAAYMKSLRGAP